MEIWNFTFSKEMQSFEALRISFYIFPGSTHVRELYYKYYK